MRFTANGSNALYCLAQGRGDYRADSDYDIAVFIEAPGALTEELNRLAEIATDILDEMGAVINPLPLRAGSYRLETGLLAPSRVSHESSCDFSRAATSSKPSPITGSAMRWISGGEAATTIETAERFVACIAGLIE
jgi:hypothetical protein